MARRATPTGRHSSSWPSTAGDLSAGVPECRRGTGHLVRPLRHPPLFVRTRPKLAVGRYNDFCTAERWHLVRGAAGKPVTHHRTYELTLWDGRVLRTRISKPVDASTYGASMFRRDLRRCGVGRRLDQRKTRTERWTLLTHLLRHAWPQLGGRPGHTQPRFSR